MKATTRRGFFTVAFILLLAVAIISTFRIVNVNANSNKDFRLNKYYTTYEIQPGDTLTSIAKHYTEGTGISVNDYVEELKENNNLGSKGNIVSGAKLIVSYYSEEVK